jgi:hypothetical protein
MTWLLPSFSCDILGMIWDKHQQKFVPSNYMLLICNNNRFRRLYTATYPCSKQTTSDQHFANCGAVGNPCNLQPYSVGFIFSITIMLAATYSILARSKLYSPQGFPLSLISFILSYSTPAHHKYTTISARWQQIQYRMNSWRYIKYGISWHTTLAQTQVSSPRCCQCSHQIYHPGYTFENCPQD